MPRSPRLHRRKLLTTLLATPAAFLPASVLAQSATPSFRSTQPFVAPLQPAYIQVNIPGYTGPSAIILFDARKRYAGTVEGQIENGQGIWTAFPRGALGPQWAALFMNGQEVATNANLFTLDAQTSLTTGQWRYDAFIPAVKTLMGQAILNYPLGDRIIHGYRSPDSALIWLRDHIYQQRAARYFDDNLRVALDAFRDAQYPDGSFPDFLDRPEAYVSAMRTPVEADVEYLYVQGVYELWQASGDDGWLRTHLGNMRRALTYTIQSPIRWDGARGLVKRPYTIDTWDFEVGPTTIDPTNGKPAPRHWIDENTIWGIFHGDNTGMAQSLSMLAKIEDRIGDPNLAQLWRDISASITGNLNELAWNGRFFQHHVPFTEVELPGVDAERQLSLSNAFALNRGTLTPEQGQAILTEYIERGAEDMARYASGSPDGAFAGWYSIDPPFPYGTVGLAGRSGEIPGSYVNGGIMPLVGGELARGAFRYGQPEFGFATLDYYWLRMLSRGRTFLWYHRDGAEGVGSDDTIPSDGWSAGSMLLALIEGAAGIIDNSIAYRDVTISPHWGTTPDVREAYASIRYALGDGYAAYRWIQGERAIVLDATGSADLLRLAIPLPASADNGSSLSVTLNGAPIPFGLDQRPDGLYVLLESRDSVVQVRIDW